MTEPNDPMPTIHETFRDIHAARIGSLDFTAIAAGLPPTDPAPVVDIAPPARRHAENASELLDHAEEVIGTEQQRRREPDPLTLAMMAQVEATLALVAQQRIANLIAWQALTGEGSRVAIRRELEP